MSFINSKFKAFLVLFMAGLITLAAFVFAIETVSKLVLDNKFSRAEKPSFVDFVLSKPSPFRDVKDFDVVVSTQFGSKCQPNRIKVKSNGFPKFETENTDCEGFRLVNGLRHTTDQPTNYRNEIHIFGGSTTWGTGSSDPYTIPSILQRLINQKYPGKYKVFNHGFSTVVAKQELVELKDTKLRSGDIVIFYDGGNDVWQGVVYGET